MFLFIQSEKFVLNWMFSFVTAVRVLDLLFSWSEGARGVCVHTFETCDRQPRKILFWSTHFIVGSFSTKQAELKPADDISARSKWATDAIKNIKTKCFNNKSISNYILKTEDLMSPTLLVEHWETSILRDRKCSF